MPNRIIREGMLTSRKVDQIFGLTELFYRRLQQIVDDYGRFEADPTLLRSKVFPKRINDIKEKQVSRWLEKCVEADLVEVYTVNGINYLQVKNFRQQVRAKKSFYPGPSEADAQHMPSTRAARAEHMRSLDVDVDVDALSPPHKTAARVNESFEQFWHHYPRKTGKGKALDTWNRHKLDPLLDQILSTLSWQTRSREWQEQNGRFVPHPATWLNQKRWLDEPATSGLSPPVKNFSGPAIPV